MIMIPKKLIKYKEDIEFHIDNLNLLKMRSEVYLLNILEYRWKYNVIDTRNETEDRLILYKNPLWHNYYSINVEFGLNENHGNLIINTNETGSLYKIKSDLCWYVNPNTGWMQWYSREKMKEWVEKNHLKNSGFYEIKKRRTLSFINRKKEIVL